jgi:hypothetical protein
MASATVAKAAANRSMDNPAGSEIHQKNDRFKKIEDLREARAWMSNRQLDIFERVGSPR